MTTYPVQRKRWTRAEYDRLIEIGVFGSGQPVELVGGELIVSEPQGSSHYTAIGLTEDALRTALGPGWVVRTQACLLIRHLARPRDLARRTRHPGTVLSGPPFGCRALRGARAPEGHVRRWYLTPTGRKERRTEG